jgi:hypothetical protein
MIPLACLLTAELIEPRESEHSRPEPVFPVRYLALLTGSIEGTKAAVCSVLIIFGNVFSNEFGDVDGSSPER